jgi:hypothetical protein
LSKYVLFYEAAEDVLATASLHFAAHRAIFATREAATEFAEGDPFVLNGSFGIGGP